MNLKHPVIYFSILLTVLLCQTSLVYKKVGFMKYVTEYMKNKMRVERVTLFQSKVQKYYCPTAIGIIKELKVDFPTSVLDAQDVYEESKAIRILMNNMQRPLTVPKTNEMVILLIDIHRNYQLFRSEFTKQYILFFRNSIERIPFPHCLILILSNKRIPNLLRYLSFMWSEKILRVNVIEVIVTKNIDRRRRRNRDALRITNYKISSTINQINPFTRKYLRKSNFENVNFFPNFFQNVHKYPLRVTYTNSLYRLNFSNNNIKSANDWDYGSDGAPIVIIIKKMNFSLIKIPIRSVEGYRYILNQRADINAWAVSIVSIYQTTDSYVGNIKGLFIVKNSINYEIHFPWNSFIMMLINVISVLIFAFLKKSMRFINDFWSAYNVTLILLGRGEISFPRGHVARIVFLTLIVVSITFTTEMIQQIFDYSFVKKKIDVIQTYDEILNSNKTFYTDNSTMLHFDFVKRIYGDRVIPKNIFQITNATLENDKRELMINTKCNLLHMIDYIATMQANLISKTISVNIVPITLHYDFLRPYLTTSQFPFLGRFNKLLRRLFESGIMAFCEKRAFFDYVYRNKIQLSLEYKIQSEADTMEAFLWGYNRKNLPTKQIFMEDVDTALHIKLLYFCGIGLIISLISFIIELLLRRR